MRKEESSEQIPGTIGYCSMTSISLDRENVIWGR